MKTIRVKKRKRLIINVCNGDEFEEILAEKGFPSFLERKSPIYTDSYDATRIKKEMKEILAKRRISNEDEDSRVFCLGYFHREEGKKVRETYFDLDANKSMVLDRMLDYLADAYGYSIFNDDLEKMNEAYMWARHDLESIGLL